MTPTKPEGLPEGMVARNELIATLKAAGGLHNPEVNAPFVADAIIARFPSFTPTKAVERAYGPVPYIEYDPETDPDYLARVASPTPTKAATAEGQGELKPCPLCAVTPTFERGWICHPDSGCLLAGYEFGDATKTDAENVAAWNARPSFAKHGAA